MTSTELLAYVSAAITFGVLGFVAGYLYCKRGMR